MEERIQWNMERSVGLYGRKNTTKYFLQLQITLQLPLVYLYHSGLKFWLIGTKSKFFMHRRIFEVNGF